MLAAEAGDHPVVLHCFSLPERLDEVVERGYMLSFAGPVTFPRSIELQRGRPRRARPTCCWWRPTAPTSPRSRAAAGPTARPTSPTPCASSPRLRGVSEEELDELTSANAARAFGW